MLRRGAALALVTLLGSAAGCGTTGPVWYKPGNYTTEEFNRDRDACTKDKKVDPECLKAKGWIPVTQDIKPTTTDPRAGRPGRY